MPSGTSKGRSFREVYAAKVLREFGRPPAKIVLDEREERAAGTKQMRFGVASVRVVCPQSGELLSETAVNVPCRFERKRDAHEEAFKIAADPLFYSGGADGWQAAEVDIASMPNPFDESPSRPASSNSSGSGSGSAGTAKSELINLMQGQLKITTLLEKTDLTSTKKKQKLYGCARLVVRDSKARGAVLFSYDITEPPVHLTKRAAEQAFFQQAIDIFNRYGVAGPPSSSQSSKQSKQSSKESTKQSKQSSKESTKQSKQSKQSSKQSKQSKQSSKQSTQSTQSTDLDCTVELTDVPYQLIIMPEPVGVYEALPDLCKHQRECAGELQTMLQLERPPRLEVAFVREVSVLNTTCYGASGLRALHPDRPGLVVYSVDYRLLPSYSLRSEAAAVVFDGVARLAQSINAVSTCPFFSSSLPCCRACWY